uniref:DNA-directed RNA polymerase n=1 Tax=Marseillevirus LCMAC102 TaxID=2506603 RepID=A0A481YT31_9VIRU|nr:MAG: DNA-directed RNA polymerase subunit beta [Marseillevirus LCMAC102]
MVKQHMFIAKDYANRPSSDGPKITDDDAWPVIQSFFTEHGFLSHQIESFNEFIIVAIPEIIETNRRIEINVDNQHCYIEFGEVILHSPQHKELSDEIRYIVPKECIDRDISYLSDILIDFEFETPLGLKCIFEHVHIGSIPVMVKSQLCNLHKIADDPEKLATHREDLFDDGGYFIIKGAQKILASQERTACNKVYIFKNRKVAPKYILYAEVRSNSLSGAHSTITQAGFLANMLISIMVPYIEMTAIPLGVVFKALGATDEKDIVKYILPDTDDKEALGLLLPSLEQSYECDNQEVGLHFIGRCGKKFMGTRNSFRTGKDNCNEIDTQTRTNAISYAKHLLSTEFLPHLGTGTESFTKKRFYLGYMVQKLIDARLGRRALEDRDHYANKRIATPGILLSQLFHNAFKRLRSEIVNSIERCIRGKNPINLLSIIKSGTITSIMNNALSSNAWGGRKAQGVSQMFDRFNFAAGIANLRKLVTPISAEGGKVEAPRELHNSHWGIVCSTETPEGKKCGLVKNIAMGGLITNGSKSADILGMLQNMKIIEFDEIALSMTKELLGLVKIFVNGDPIGVTKYPQNIVSELRLLRRSCNLDPEISISYNVSNREICISTEAGRLCRPLFIVEGGNILLRKNHIDEMKEGKWDDIGSIWTKLLENGFVEFIDKAEESEINIAICPSKLEKMQANKRSQITHCELHPSMMFGVGTSLIPFPDHNQSPRNTYQASMGKQAVGVPGSNYMFQTKGKFHVLAYPQKPLVSSKISKILGFDNLPSGQNTIVAVCPWYGFGQEDSIIMNQDSIDRGFMLSTLYIAFEGKVRLNKKEQFEVPTEKDCSNYKGNSSKLDPITGIITEGQKVEEGDILIGRTVYVDETLTVHRQKKQNISVIYDNQWSGTVHLIQKGIDGQGYEYVRVVIAQQRFPINGDKFCYSLDHEVLTTKGWIPIDCLSKDYKVATLNQKGCLEYQHPTDIVSFDHEGDMIEVETNQLSLKVTPNHKMYVKCSKEFKLETAADLFNIPVYYKKNAEWVVPGLEYFELPGVWYNDIIYPSQNLPIEPWLVFFGIWIAEGYGENKCRIHIAKVKTTLMKALEDLGYKYTIQENDILDINDKQLADYMSALLVDKQLDYMPAHLVDAINRYLPEWVWSLNEKQCRILLDSMCIRNTQMYDTYSVRLKDDVLRLALHCGWAANCYIRYSKRDSTVNADSWRITIVTKHLEPVVNKHIKRQQKSVLYSGKVYCCTVPNHVLYVRRAASSLGECQKPVWSGNSARHGQKGTIGMTYRSYDLPFTDEGITPDIIINPLAFPSRMTIGMMIEMITGRKIVLGSRLNAICAKKAFRLDHDDDPSDGEDETQCKTPKGGYSKTKSDGDATPFNPSFSLKSICNELKTLGYNEFSDEKMTNGQTGEEMKCLIFVGVPYYQRLKHMVIDKVHARSRGGRTRLTRQPKEGRKQGGGFRVGHMEKDVILGQGSAWFNKDRLMEQSDETRIWFCKICGLQALVIVGDPQRNIPPRKECRVCQSNKVALVRMPYATKLLMQELAGMNVIMRVLPTTYDEVSLTVNGEHIATGKIENPSQDKK